MNISTLDYELFDSGNGEKLERFGTYIVIRPDKMVVWPRQKSDTIWEQANARYIRTSKTEGHWDISTPPPDPWTISYGEYQFLLQLSIYKHVGIFPEQQSNWEWLDRVIHHKPLKILNLFAYTGVASIVCAKNNAMVTHVDSAKSTIAWAKENAIYNGISSIRWICEDALTFVDREIKRGNTYDGIIMDPPLFGRGARGQTWHIDSDLPKLFNNCLTLLSTHYSFINISFYSEFNSNAFVQHVKNHLKGNISCIPLVLATSRQGHDIPAGFTIRWFSSSKTFL